MSVSDADSIVTSVEELTQSNICAVSATALLLFDWMITVDRETEVVWSGSMNVARVLYVLSRIVGPSANIVSMVMFSPVTDEVCRALTNLENVLCLLPYGIWALFASLRTYALSGHKILLSGVIFALMMVPVAVNTYTYVFSEAANYGPPIGCVDGFNGPHSSTYLVPICECLSLNASVSA
ncbi:hypothetical protein OH77DRAFT_1513980 [Trametes cingulata]|nr:hypothetical protein OH77DRAFT_1513980 [Trametes cingulata]